MKTWDLSINLRTKCGLNAVAVIHKMDLREEQEAVINIREAFETSLKVERISALFAMFSQEF
ncbi:hypothetical protein CLFO_13390 [Clostridium formicaceticum]|uniref:Uncharacterized protein n=1 Tax=Clostridium formicaceticum TaxID=1497 RepID=A0AAC9WGR5_9CLOT|nr:hypothetical protein [Clostridium formicaceticum]AOY76541.1 hypothetical protein BJL90_12130 [Clostridium formicaceticum]ARE86955.1 hypothetical protein CLFO_13390 [Clostridium formicaceticum]